MPRSYLSDEPACQRAERNHFDPYLQVVSRLRALTHMGHVTDKVELIVLGGTWSDYPAPYQIWFVKELFRALNDGLGGLGGLGGLDGLEAERDARVRRASYRARGLSNRAEDLAARVCAVQREVDDGALSYNQAIERLYGSGSAWEGIAREQRADLSELAEQHRANETARHRVVGLAVETRPDTITADSLRLLRRLGCTKVQIGVQSLDPAILRLNGRGVSVGRIRRAFELLRVFGFKIHVHFMLNLYGSTPAADVRDYRRLVTEAPYLPDEVKLYPCSLVAGTGLVARFADGSWRPYDTDELLSVLTADLLNTPPFIRVSRMIRDISAHDILAGNRRANLRQLVESGIEGRGERVAEIRYREIGTDETAVERLRLEALVYRTTVSEEHFLQWVTPDDRIVGFLRLSLPKAAYVRAHRAAVPVAEREAMIREVHVYGKVAELRQTGEDVEACRTQADVEPHRAGEGAQHLGLGRRLIEAACDRARERGYERVNVISSVGTREYYRALGFEDNDLYQRLSLVEGSGEPCEEEPCVCSSP
jgi:elongator complex protein 3